MPVRYVIIAARRLVVTACSGRVTVSEMLQNAKRLSTDADFDSTFSQLIDLHECSGTDATVEHLRYFAEDDDSFSPSARRAVFAPSPLGFGMARMYEALRGEATNFAVFRTINEACQWLGLEQAALLAELHLSKLA
jgi:hypothetical protein